MCDTNEKKLEEKFDSFDYSSIVIACMGSALLGWAVMYVTTKGWAGLAVGLGSFLIILSIGRAFNKIVRLLEANGFKFEHKPPSED